MSITLEVRVTGMCAITLERQAYAAALLGQGVRSTEQVLMMGGCHHPRLLVAARDVSALYGYPLRPGAEVLPGPGGEPWLVIDTRGFHLAFRGEDDEQGEGGALFGPINPRPQQYRRTPPEEWGDLGYVLNLQWLHTDATLKQTLARMPPPLGDAVESSVLLDRGIVKALPPSAASLDVEHDFGGQRRQQVAEGFVYRYSPKAGDGSAGTKVSIDFRQPAVEAGNSEADPRHTITFRNPGPQERLVQVHLSAQCAWTEPLRVLPAPLDVADYEPLVRPRLIAPEPQTISREVTSDFPRCPSALVVRQ